MAEVLVFTQNVQTELEGLLRGLSPSACFVLCDTNTRQHAEPLADALEARLLCIPAGEQHKNIASAELLWRLLLDARADRQAVLLNIGGGMITDLGGFVAGNLKRGIRYINLPTSLLAQVDAAVGGKTGINLNGLKNAVGLFYPPEAVVFNDQWLRTLPERELISGKAEMFKHGILADPLLFEALQVLHPTHAPPLELIQRAVEIKCSIVSLDPTEQGERKLLNFGHTFGHAVESYFLAAEAPLLHGEAIFMGMLLETRLAVALGLLPEAAADSIATALHPYQPELACPHIEALMPWLVQDKKNSGAKINFSLPAAVGEAIFDQKLTPDALRGHAPQIYRKS